MPLYGKIPPIPHFSRFRESRRRQPQLRRGGARGKQLADEAGEDPHRPTELARPFARLLTGPPRFPNPHRVGRGLKRSHPWPVQALLLGKHATDLTPGATMGAPTTVTRDSVDLPFLGGRSRMPRSRRTFRGMKCAHVTVGLPLLDDTSSEQHAHKLRIAFVPS